ncbi:MAG: hypothetical protein J6T55_02270 [Alphaproteobacteria bacterium]|nr:hypothetical protein [Alphaproteobacteria bacterium]
MSLIENIFIANSVYAEFLYLLRFPEKTNNTLFLVGPSCSAIEVPNRIPIIGPKDMKNLPLLRDHLVQQVWLLLRGRRVPCYGNVETIYSAFFVNTFPFYPISDGLWDVEKFPVYLNDPGHFIKCYSVRYPGGLDKENERLEYINIQSCWKKLNKGEQATFANRFGIEQKTLSLLEKRKVLLVTQPLSEDNIVSEADKIDVYRSIISQYNTDDIVIKPHPRENTNWRNIFPDIPVIPQLAPAELLGLLVPHLERVATFFSTAACNMLAPEKIDFYSKDFAKLKMMENGRFDGNKPLKPAATFDLENTLKEKNNFNWLRLPDDKFYTE